MPEQTNKVIIANMSGFYGDRFSAAKEMVEGGSINFLTGDYLAELTMAILHKAKVKNPEMGYAVTFLKQMESIMGICLDKKIKVVVNAGGLNPSGLAKALREIALTLKLRPKIAFIEGDDLMTKLNNLKEAGVKLKHLDNGNSLFDSGMPPLSANAYLGCWGIVEALNHEADIVLTGRVADTSLVIGPAAFFYGWEKNNWDALAGAAAAGHVIECGGQASGGNYSFFEEVKSYKNLGFPIAEIFEDGSSIITKHPNTGGLINIGTVTAQLMYEINDPEYITPDVVSHFDTIQLKAIGKDKVSMSKVKGSPATPSSKVTINCKGGYQNSMTFYIAGLENKKKAELLEKSIFEKVGGENVFDQIEFNYYPTAKENPNSNEEAFSQLRVSVIDQNPQKAGKYFTSKIVELALVMVPGVCWMHPPLAAKNRIVHFPSLIEKKYLQQKVNIEGMEILVNEYYNQETILADAIPKNDYNYQFAEEPQKEIFLGNLYAARSGDKGGNANLGVWARNQKSYAFLRAFLTVEKLKELLPDTSQFEIKRYDFPNLFGVNFYLIGFLGEGVAANSKYDGQAKTLGEYLRAKKIMVPESLIIG